jgi:hypothetical protein
MYYPITKHMISPTASGKNGGIIEVWGMRHQLEVRPGKPSEHLELPGQFSVYK